MLKLNLGCADRSVAGYLGVDISPPADVIADLNGRWPWNDSTVDEVIAYDIFEHLPSKYHTLHELWRVLKPNGVAKIEVPCAAHGAGAWQDPTHVSYWTGNDFTYYEKGNGNRERFRNNTHYGIAADFRILEAHHSEYQDKFDKVFKFHITLQAIK